MFKLIKEFDEDRFMAVAVLLGLHDPEIPNEPMLNHMNMAQPEHQGMPYSALSRDVRERELFAQLAKETGLGQAMTAESYRVIIADVLATLGITVTEQQSEVEMEGILVQYLLTLANKGIPRYMREDLSDLLEEIAEKQGQKAGGSILNLLTTKRASGFWVWLAAAVILPAFCIMASRQLSMEEYNRLASPVTKTIVDIGLDGLGLKNIEKISTPNYRCLIPLILLITAERIRKSVRITI